LIVILLFVVALNGLVLFILLNKTNDGDSVSSSKCGDVLENILQGMNYSEQTGSSEYGNGMKISMPQLPRNYKSSMISQQSFVLALRKKPLLDARSVGKI